MAAVKALSALGLVGLDIDEIELSLGEYYPKFRARQIYEAIYHQRVTNIDQISNIPKDLREKLTLGLPEIERVYQSTDGTRRYLLRLADGKTVESVWMPEGERATVCISSQVGCPVDCKFCLTALMGLERSLTAGEIVGQVLCIAADQNVTPHVDRLNIVMMGQGEPLLNLPNVLKATRLLADQRGGAISTRRITVSTSGITPKIQELGQAEIRPKLAISLNASYEEQRRQLMPVTRKYHLAELIAACRAYPLRPKESITFEYVLMKDVNDTDEDARRVVKLLAKMEAKVNLIALNPGPGIPFATPTPERVNAFQAIVRKSIPCYLRKPRGLDVFAACGQLKRMEGGPLTVLS
ncbi:MAG: 23S rRNA (adenine(2503)-C(2))-methyltransferase RlmN [Acidobacteriota bacterium]